MNGSQRRPLIWSWPPVPGHPGSQRPADSEKPEEEQGSPAKNCAMAEQTGGLAYEDSKAPEKTSAPEAAGAMMEKKEPAGGGIEKAAEEEVEVPVEDLAQAPLADTLPAAPEERIPPSVEGHHPMPGPGPEPSTGLPEMRLARAYVLYQRFGPTYSPREALERGTLFPDLYSPYPY